MFNREEVQQVARNRLLHSGRVEAVVGDMRILRTLNREAPRDQFNQGLAVIRANGEYRAIERRYSMY